MYVSLYACMQRRVAVPSLDPVDGASYLRPRFYASVSDIVITVTNSGLVAGSDCVIAFLVLPVITPDYHSARE